jgi:spoIIIJ-associated protein
MEWVETTGKTVEEAKEAVLDELGVDYSEAEFEILEEPKVGFLGLSKRPARVRGRIIPVTPKSKDGRRMKRRKPSQVRDEASSNNKVATGLDREGKPAQNGYRPERNKDMQDKDTERSKAGEDSPKPEISRTELAVVAQHFLADLLYELEMLATVSIDHLDDDSMELSITGDNLGSLIGQKGSVIAAVQELTRAVVQAHAGDSAGRVMVDVDGYRKKRREALERFTRSMAEVVLSTGEEKVFEPMVSSDRKVVHDVVAQIEGVSSRSEGEEPNRYVVIFASSVEEVKDQQGAEVSS